MIVRIYLSISITIIARKCTLYETFMYLQFYSIYFEPIRILIGKRQSLIPDEDVEYVATLYYSLGYLVI